MSGPKRIDKKEKIQRQRNSIKNQAKRKAAVIDYPMGREAAAYKRAGKQGLSAFEKLFAFFALVLAIVTIVSLLPQFRLKQIEISGNIEIDQEQILELIELEDDQHMIYGLGPGLKKIFSWRYGGIEEKILTSFPQLSLARVSFSWPSSLRIELEERLGISSIRNGAGYALVDKEGIVISTSAEAVSYLPIIEGISGLEVLEPGQNVSEEKLDLLLTATEITAQLILADEISTSSQSLLKMSKSISPMPHGLAIINLLFDSGVVWRVKISSGSTLPDNINKIHELMLNEELLSQGSGQLDLTSERIVFSKDSP